CAALAPHTDPAGTARVARKIARALRPLARGSAGTQEVRWLAEGFQGVVRFLPQEEANALAEVLAWGLLRRPPGAQTAGSAAAGPLSPQQVGDLLRPPACVGSAEQALLAALPRHLKARAQGAWLLARGGEAGRAVDLAAPPPIPRLVPRAWRDPVT